MKPRESLPENAGMNGSDIERIQERIGEVEFKLIEQEHRLWPVIRNLVRYFRVPGRQRKAAVSAFLWRLLYVGGAGGIGIAALLTLYVGWKTLGEYRRQNDIVQQQTQVLIEQNVFLQRSSNVVELSSLIEDLETARLSEALRPDSIWVLPRSLVYRIVALSNVFEPKVMRTGDLSFSVSQERGLLLKALTENRADFPLLPNPDFTSAALDQAVFNGADLSGANLQYADFRSATLIGANLSWANLTGAKLNNANLANADLTGARLIASDLTVANLMGANLDRTHIADARLAGANFIDSNLEKAIGLSTEQFLNEGVMLDTRLDSILHMESP